MMNYILCFPSIKTKVQVVLATSFSETKECYTEVDAPVRERHPTYQTFHCSQNHKTCIKQKQENTQDCRVFR